MPIKLHNIFHLSYCQKCKELVTYSVDGDVGKWVLLYMIGGNVNWQNLFGGKHRQFILKAPSLFKYTSLIRIKFTETHWPTLYL